MQNPLLQIAGSTGVDAGRTSGRGDLADQLGGPAMDLQAFDLKVGLHHREVQMGLATAFLRVLSDADRRANEIMKA